MNKRFVITLLLFSIAACGGSSNSKTTPPKKITQFTVNATSSDGGSISPASQKINENKIAEFTLTPNANYIIDTVTGCNGSLAVSTYTTGIITAACTVNASFKLAFLGTGKLNDTGITTCSDATTNGLACPVIGFEGQDAEYGRDAQSAAGTLTKVGAGKGGFDFTKLDTNGNALPASATEWVCVKDNHTGLVWEVKTTDGGLRDTNNTYTWYNSDNSTNGGNVGTENGGSCPDTGNCDTEKYVASVNALNQNNGLCGANDWSMPSREELRSIVDYGTNSPAIDTTYFINTQLSWYWSASANAYYYDYAWFVNFWYGDGDYDNKYSSRGGNYVRLVRGGQ